MMYSYLQEHFNDWIVAVCPEFSVDLNKGNFQWASVCKNMGVRPGKVFIVTETYLEERKGGDYTLVDAIVKKLLEGGHMVIDAHNCAACSNCGKVIVSQQRLMENQLIFSGQCQGCYRYDPRTGIPL